jgi:hypothetical protein
VAGQERHLARFHAQLRTPALGRGRGAGEVQVRLAPRGVGEDEQPLGVRPKGGEPGLELGACALRNAVAALERGETFVVHPFTPGLNSVRRFNTRIKRWQDGDFEG